MKDLVVNVENATVRVKGRVILDNLSLQIKRGDHHFILGANGAGKTTLVKMLMGFLEIACQKNIQRLITERDRCVDAHQIFQMVTTVARLLLQLAVRAVNLRLIRRIQLTCRSVLLPGSPVSHAPVHYGTDAP